MPTIIDEFPSAPQNLGAAGAESEGKKGNGKASAASTTEAAR